MVEGWPGYKKRTVVWGEEIVGGGSDWPQRSPNPGFEIIMTIY